MAEHVSTEDNFHTYAYSVADLARAVALTLEYAQANPDAIASIRSCKDRAEAIALTFDDAHDGNEPWDVDDVAHGMVRTVM